MAIIFSILMSLGIISNHSNTPSATSNGYNQVKHQTYTENTKGGVDWGDLGH